MVKICLRIVVVVALLAVLLVVSLGIYLTRGKVLEQWHEPASFAEPFDFDASNFQDYVNWSERRIKASRTDNPTLETVNNLLPFELVPDPDCPVNNDGKYANGIVLIHGLIASPWSMKPIGDDFQVRCFYVLGVLLTGHGTRPGDMLNSSWEDWDRDVQYATRLLSEKVDRVFLSGHSAGATLAVLESVRNPAVDALILFAPAMAIVEASKFARYIQLLGKIFPGASWFELEPEDGVYRYESFSFSVVADTWELIQVIWAALSENPLTIPVMTVASSQDTTVDAQATYDFMAGQANPLSFTLLYSQHNLPPYERTLIYPANDLGQGILSLGHLGLMTPPDHPHYGRNGDYRYCSQYYNQDNEDFASCKAGQRDYYGETTEENMQLGIIERIAFNPFYSDLLAEIDLFLDQINMDRKGFPIQRRGDAFNQLDLDN